MEGQKKKIEQQRVIFLKCSISDIDFWYLRLYIIVHYNVDFTVGKINHQ